MGRYVNPSNKSLIADMNDEIYIDKSLLLSELNKVYDGRQRFVCVSRPRRFGKTMAGNLISSFYSKGCDSRKIFEDLKISQTPNWDKHINKANVIKIDLGAELSLTDNKNEVVKGIERRTTAEMRNEFPSAGIKDDDKLAIAIWKAYVDSGEKETFVIIIDEYDAIVRAKARKELIEEYIDFLNGLFKNSGIAESISLAYITGILPIVSDVFQSKLNNFDQYTMLDSQPLSPFFGFTSEETCALCAKHGMDFEEFRKWYDGYTLTPDIEIYNPRSVGKAIKSQALSDYWNKTGSYDSISEYVGLNFDGTKDSVAVMLGGGEVTVNVSSFLNTMDAFRNRDDVFTYLIHLGYLAYNANQKTCKIPNCEIRMEWVNALSNTPNYSRIVKLVTDSRHLLERTLAGDADAVAQALATAHEQATNPLTYNDESSFQSAIGLAYFYATTEYTIVKEMPAGKGYADVVFIPTRQSRPAIIIELKVDKTADSALKQIEEKRYPNALSGHYGEVILVGISYSKESKKHKCVIKRGLIPQ